MAEFFAMGGYAAWVWSAWGASAAGVIILIVYVLSERGAAKARLAELEDDME